MLDKPTLELIQQTAVMADGAEAKVAIIKIPQEPSHVYGVINHEGDFLKFEAAPQPRAHVLVTLDEVLKFAKFVSGQPIAPKPVGLIAGPTQPETSTDSKSAAADEEAGELGDEGEPVGETIVWYDRPAIVVILDDFTRRDRATMELKFTPQMQQLLELEEKQTKFNQVAFRRLLKIELAGCRQDDAVLNWVSAMKFSNNSTAGGVITNQRASLGKAVDDAASSELGPCPETMTLQVRIFDDPSLRDTWPVECEVEILAPEQSFRLVPLPMQLHDAIEAQLSVIGDHLATNLACPVFRGQP